jgi:hypothetical protein
MLAVAVRWQQCPQHAGDDTHCPHYVSTITGAGRFNRMPDQQNVCQDDIERALTQKVLALQSAIARNVLIDVEQDRCALLYERTARWQGAYRPTVTTRRWLETRSS